MKKGVLLVLILCSFFAVQANNVQLQGTVKVVSVTGSVATLEVDLSWENSWRDDYNWDATWLFFKYKAGVDGTWQHAAINTATATVTGGDYTTMSATTGATAQGVFVHPSKDRGGNTGALKVQVQWNTSYTKAQFDNNDVFVVAHGIEMVYIPYGAYTIGDGSSTNTFTKQVIDSEVTWNGTNAAFPKGYQGFYVMKHETSQEQYIEFLNTLTLAQQTALIPGVDALSVGDFVFGANKKAPNHRNSVILSGKIAGKPLIFDNNLNNNKVYGEEDDGGTLAMNYMSITDACGYASWAGLRPMTEMEYEKACRRPYPQEPDAGEYAWNSTTGAVNAAGLTLPGSGREIAATGNVNAGGTINSPVRCGIFARPTTSTQAAAGATYWGVMEMSGNVAELCATITNTTISRTTNGSGSYNVNLWGTVPDCYGTRGGGFLDTHLSLTTSSRVAVSRFTDVLQRDSDVGFRCVFTYNAAGAVNAGTIDANLATICPGDRVTFSGTPASAGAVKITGYVWSVNINNGGFTIVSGASAETITYSNFEAGKTYVFVRKAICPLGEASTSGVSLRVIIPKLLAGSISGNSRCDVGEVAVNHVTPATIECNVPITYSWLVNGVVVADSVRESLVYTMTAPGSFPVIRRATANGETADATITIKMTSPAPRAGSITCGVASINTPVTISNSSSGSVGCGSFAYSWLIDNSPISGAGSSLTYTFTQVKTYSIIRRVTADNGTIADAVLSVAVNDCGQLNDPRDGKTYTAGLMADGKCWMTQDLKFGTCNTNTFSTYSQKSVQNQISSGYYGVCVVGSSGYLYNWQAAMNRSDAYYNGGTPPAGVQGICPVGWHLPTKAEYQSLYDSGGSTTALKFAQIQGAWKAALGGQASSNGTISSAGSNGRYWSSTYNSAATAYTLNVYASSANPANGNYRYYGNAVRCVKN